MPPPLIAWGPAAAFGMNEGHRGPGKMMRHCDGGSMGMRAMTENPVYQSFDVDEDGTVTPAELETGVAALHSKHDGDGVLSSEEFAALFADVTRGFSQRPFSMLDADDDGQISAEEMSFPAKMMGRMQMMHDDAPEGANR